MVRNKMATLAAGTAVAVALAPCEMAEAQPVAKPMAAPASRPMSPAMVTDRPGASPVGEPGVGANMAIPRLTPRGTEVMGYPAPAVAALNPGGFHGPYGVGLAAAAPVGTPYLRSPAFAGPPVIYMPQTVTRVLVPGVTPYPANIMAPAAQYIYASAPFTRTDLYVNLPYGTYYWPQGYAGTTPVQPQVAAYLMAPGPARPATADSALALDRYASPTAETADAAITPAPALSAPAVTVSKTTIETVEPSVTPLPAFPTAVATPAPTPVPTPMPTPAPTATDSMPSLPPAGPDAGLPNLSAPGLSTISTPAPVAPAPASDAAPSVNADKPGIVVDDKSPNALVLEPTSDWKPSASLVDAYEGSALVADVDGKARTATFTVDVPDEATYEVFLWWPGSNERFRSVAVPVTVETAAGPQKLTIDQTRNTKSFNSIGTFKLKAGKGQKLVTVSTEGITAAGPTVAVTVDALKLVKVQ